MQHFTPTCEMLTESFDLWRDKKKNLQKYVNKLKQEFWTCFIQSSDFCSGSVCKLLHN